MNKKKIAFIICYNNELYLYECLKYISFLRIPEEMEIETITISDAPSMTAGYNAAMRSTDAKYKVYLHQDVFILYQDFVYDVVKTFEKYPEYGLLGVIGGDNIPADANFWCQWNEGCTYANDTLFQYDLKYSNDKEIIPVSIIDGMIMITQYDISWREDIFDSFDFYDASQSLEFYKAGYRIGIPYQKETWCIHDCGHSKLKNYDKYRKIFCQEYAELGFIYKDIPEQIKDIEKIEDIKKDIPFIEKLIEEHRTVDSVNAINEVLKKTSRNTQICILNILCQILLKEEEEQIQNGFFHKNQSIESLIQQYYGYRFFLMRIYYEKPLEDYIDMCLELASQEDKGICTVSVISKCIALTEEEAKTILKKYFYLVNL